MMIEDKKIKKKTPANGCASRFFTKAETAKVRKGDGVPQCYIRQSSERRNKRVRLTRADKAARHQLRCLIHRVCTPCKERTTAKEQV